MGVDITSIVINQKKEIMLKAIKQFVLLALVAGVMSSCYTTQVTVGDVPSNAKTENIPSQNNSICSGELFH